MNIHESAEDYLERILMLQEKNGHVRSIDIAIDMGYSKASISRAVKNLKEDCYIEVESNGYLVLTPKGLNIATKIYERHKILSTFFEKMGVNEKIALQDACKVEHDLSEETFNAIKKLNERL